jgi:autotransporter-associated beta strand protein
MVSTATPLIVLVAALILCGGRSNCEGQTIQVSAAMPVTNQTVTITVPGLPEGGVISITDSHAATTQVVVDSQSRAFWTPTRYGKYAISSGAAVQTMWVTARPMTFHWWSCTPAQTNVTAVMERNSAWQARGVIQLDWTGGEAYSRGVDGHYWTNAVDWFDGWNYAYSTQGMAIDEAYCNAGFPTDPMLQAIAMVRQTQPANYSLNLWSDGFGPSFASGAALLKSNNVTVLVEDYNGVWNLHTSRWAAVRSYGLENQAFPGIWPGTSPLTNEPAVRADMALLRLAAPEANGIAIFAPVTNNFTPPVLSSVLAACDQAIEDYFLKPLIHLTYTSTAKLRVWNLGNDDAAGFSLQFLDNLGGILQTVDLSNLNANGQWLLSIPAGAVSAKVVNPAGTANLYTGNSQYANGRFPLNVPGRYVWTNGGGDVVWSTPSNWNPPGPPPGNIDTGNFAYFDGAAIAPHAVTAVSGETSINSVQFVTGGWTISGNPVSQDFYTYGISSAGTGSNTINIGISARDVVPAVFTVGFGNTLVVNGLVGAVRSNGGLVKNGGGTLILTHTNSYTGTTTVNNGTLLVMAALASRSAVTVAPGATLGGNGTMAAPVVLNGTIAPGIGVGALATGSETWNGGGQYLCEVNSTNSTGADHVDVKGTLNVQATAAIKFIVKLVSFTASNTAGAVADFNQYSNSSWSLLTANGGVTNFDVSKFVVDTSCFSNDWNGGKFGLAVSGNDLVLNYLAAPGKPKFSGIVSAVDATELSGTGAPGRRYVLQGTANLAPVIFWTPLSTNTADTNGVLKFIDPPPADPLRRFYRLSVP